MKKLFLALALICPLSPAMADDILKNTDFTDGAQYWHGDGHTPAEIKSTDDALERPVDYGDKGLVIQLKAHQWTKIVQEFKESTGSVTINITYKLAPGTIFSEKDDDYTNVTHSIDFDAWPQITAKKNNWVVMLTDLNNGRFFNDSVEPKLGTTASQTFTDEVDSVDPHNPKTLCLAFPPGTGAIILLRVSLEKH